jgi:hypothetical protein
LLKKGLGNTAIDVRLKFALKSEPNVALRVELRVALKTRLEVLLKTTLKVLFSISIGTPPKISFRVSPGETLKKVLKLSWKVSIKSLLEVSPKTRLNNVALNVALIAPYRRTFERPLKIPPRRMVKKELRTTSKIPLQRLIIINEQTRRLLKSQSILLFHL